MSSIPELQRLREIRKGALETALLIGSEYDVARCASRLLEIDEQINPSRDVPMTWKGESK